MRELRKGPYTIGHGDAKADNFFFPAEDQEPNAGLPECITCDFQLSNICCPARDLTYFYFIILGLDVADRKNWIQPLVHVYWSTLVQLGITTYTVEMILNDIPRRLCWPLLVDIATAKASRRTCENYCGKKGRGEARTAEGEAAYARGVKHRDRLHTALVDYKVEDFLATLKDDPGVPFRGCCCCWLLK